MDDLISRQAVIEINRSYHGQMPNEVNHRIWKEINELPSAQPETHEERTETHACDYISRQAAIDAILAVTGNSSVRELYEHVQEHGLSDMWSGGVNAAIDIIIAVPSAQPEERTEERTETHACDLAEITLAGLPSAQPEPIRINLNEPIKVKLTDWGKEIYYHQYDRTNQIAGREICKPRFPREDENGYTEFQLWCFIELYGMHMGMTLPNVIEPLEIVYER